MRRGPALYAAAAKPRFPNFVTRLRNNRAEAAMACRGSKGLSRPTDAAVSGMNCAIPLRAGVAHHVGPETAFLEQQTDEEGNRQRVRLRRLHECVADFTPGALHDRLRSRRRRIGLFRAIRGALGRRGRRWNVVSCLLAAHRVAAENRERAKTNQQRQVAHVVLSKCGRTRRHASSQILSVKDVSSPHRPRARCI